MASIVDEIRDETLAVDTSSAPDQVDVVAVSSFIQTVNERVRTLQPEVLVSAKSSILFLYC